MIQQLYGPVTRCYPLGVAISFPQLALCCHRHARVGEGALLQKLGRWLEVEGGEELDPRVG